MASIRSLLSRRPSAEAIKQSRDREPSVLEINDEDADEVFSVLSSMTAREVLSALYRQPQTASEVSESVDTSLQNATYHLKNLSEAGLIEIVETWYSDQGKEMNVYAPTNEALVLYAGDNLQRNSVLTAVKQLVGFIGIFALLSLLVQYLFERHSEPMRSGMGEQAPDPSLILSPGLLFFIASVLALIAFFVWWHYRSI
ncbi:MAG: ArsR/SmtB family transcription factor [Halobacteriaceae archaeon]